VVFDPSLIDPAYPDYDLMRQIVRDAIAPPAPADDAPEDTTASAAPGTTAPAPPAPPGPAADVGDACAYDPVRAQEALAQGEPRTRNG
jgi:hypothetical protein